MAISIHLWAQCAARSCSKEFIDSSNFIKHHISYAWAAALCSPHLVMLYASNEPLLPCALNKTSQLVCLGTHCFVLNTIPTLSITRSITPPLSRSASTPLCSFQHIGPSAFLPCRTRQTFGTTHGRQKSATPMSA